MLSCFSLPFDSLLVLVLLQFPDEVPDNLDFLPTVAAGFVRRLCFSYVGLFAVFAPWIWRTIKAGASIADTPILPSVSTADVPARRAVASHVLLL